MVTKVKTKACIILVALPISDGDSAPAIGVSKILLRPSNFRPSSGLGRLSFNVQPNHVSLPLACSEGSEGSSDEGNSDDVVLTVSRRSKPASAGDPSDVV